MPIPPVIKLTSKSPWSPFPSLAQQGRLVLQITSFSAVRTLTHPAGLAVLNQPYTFSNKSCDNTFTYNMSWIDDGSNHTESDGLTVLCQRTDPGSPSNALFKGLELNSGAGVGYWTFTFEEIADDASPFVGLTSVDQFGKGWGFSGYMYGGPGNTSSGGAGQLMGYGEPIKTGDTIGVLAEAETANLRIYYFHNGRPLGLAFDLPTPYFNPLYPIISFSGKAKVTIAPGTGIPNERNRKEDFDPNSIAGNWRFKPAAGLNVPQGIKPTLTIKELSGNEYSGSLHIVNSIRVGLKNLGEGSWQINMGASTKMGASPDLMAFEREFSVIIGRATFLELKDGQLVFGSDPGVTFDRYAKEFAPTTRI